MLQKLSFGYMLLSVRASSISINMEDKKPNVIIVGSGHEAGLLAMKIAELKLANPNCEVVTLEEAKERGLIQTFEITAPKPLPELQQVYLKDNYFSDGKSARNKRREAERKAKKGKRRW
jgi:FlaA1/EpsC-like NDP-sugar epimerase